MIGLFDSGIGGLTVLKEVARRLPDYALLYFGDTARTPYGNKSAEVVEAYGLEAARFLVERGAKVLVVACNTVSAVGLEALRREFSQVPIFDVIMPAVEAIAAGVKPKAQSTKVTRIGVMGTRALTGSGVYQKLLGERGFEVVTHPAPLLVPLVEEGWLDRPETKRIVKTYLAPFKRVGVEALVLACTHYPLLKSVIAARLGKRIRVVDPAEETAASLQRWLSEHAAVAAALSKGESRLCVTDLTPRTELIARTWLKRTITLERVNLS